jgi:hypothetical protein
MGLTLSGAPRVASLQDAGVGLWLTRAEALAFVLCSLQELLSRVYVFQIRSEGGIPSGCSCCVVVNQG